MLIYIQSTHSINTSQPLHSPPLYRFFLTLHLISILIYSFVHSLLYYYLYLDSLKSSLNQMFLSLNLFQPPLLFQLFQPLIPTSCFKLLSCCLLAFLGMEGIANLMKDPQMMAMAQQVNPLDY